jgi:hypothetical protein
LILQEATVIEPSNADRLAIARLADKFGDISVIEECYLAGLTAGWLRGLDQAASRCDAIWGKSRICCDDDADIAHAYDRGIASSAAAIRALAPLTG